MINFILRINLIKILINKGLRNEEKFSHFIINCCYKLSSDLKSMEKPSAPEIEQPKSLWQTLPRELQQIVLSHVGLGRAKSFEEVLNNLKSLEKNPLFSDLVNNKDFIASLAKIYIEKHKKAAYEEFFNAAKENRIALVQAIHIDAGIDINAKDLRSNHFKESALIYGAQNGHKKIVKLLIKAGADVNAIENNGALACFNYSITTRI